MSWSDNNNNDPWGSSGNGSGRRGPGPNMDDVIRNAQNRLYATEATRKFFRCDNALADVDSVTWHDLSNNGLTYWVIFPLD